MRTAGLLVFSMMALLSTAAFAQSPVIVAQVSLLNQNQTISGTPLITPSASGVYRISAYMSTATAGAGWWSLQVKWVDDGNKTRETIQHWVELSSGAVYSQGTQIVRAVAGQPISYHVGQKDSPNRSYNLFITVEQLESD